MPNIHRFYAERIAQADADGRAARAVFAASDTDTGILDAANRWSDMPLGVKEAWAFYKTFVMDTDWGSVGVYSVEADGAKTVAVWTRDDGDRCWLEVYEADGTLVAAARAANGKTVWAERDTVRSQVFSGDLPTELNESQAT